MDTAPIGLRMPTPGETYVVRFHDGPLDGTSEVRVAGPGGLPHGIGCDVRGEPAEYALFGAHGNRAYAEFDYWPA